MSSHELTLVAQRFLNQPLCLHPARAPMLVAALNQRLGVNSLQMDGMIMGRQQMDAYAEAGRAEAKVRKERRAEGRTFAFQSGMAIIPVEGTLVSRNGLDPESGMTGYDGIETKLFDAESDADVKAKVMVIDSGGGDVNSLFDLVEVAYRMNGMNGGKPLYAILSDHAYSAAYALASAADRVFVPRTGGAGSIGVLMLHAEESERLAEDGVKVTVVRGGKRKALANGMEPLPAEALEHMQEQVDEIREVFVETVARNRGISAKSVYDTEGLDYLGMHAYSRKLVTDVASRHQAWAWIMKRHG